MHVSRRQFARTLTLASCALPIASKAESSNPKNWPLTAKLEEIRSNHHLPALIGGIVTCDGLQQAAVCGVRKAGGSTPATLEDLWHLASNTKPMTASLAARFVQNGIISWETTLASVFPEQSSLQSGDLGKATLSHLLHHTAGLPTNLKWREVEKRASLIPQQRLAALAEAAETALLSKPGAVYQYSNLGYVLAGAMLERVTGESWESLIQNRLFQPLGMVSAGFGGLGSVGLEDQPWPHQQTGAPAPLNGPNVDNAKVMGPAGTVHVRLSDWAKFVADHLKGPFGQSALLSSESYQALHQPGLGNYAMGWIVSRHAMLGEMTLSHAGSNTLNYCQALLVPTKQFAVLVCTNQGFQAEAAEAAQNALIHHHFKR